MAGTTAAEQTFTGFTPGQAKAYFAARGEAYNQTLYDTILTYHGARPREAVMDVGTGPGTVIFDLLPFFAKGYGSDTGVEMIEQAKREAARLGVSDRAQFAVSGAERCDQAFPGVQADVVTVAMAAHWFDMPKFYASVAKLLSPGATLALWTCSSTYVHPSVPNHREIQAILSDLEDNMLGPYALPGNMLSRNAYRDLLLPWQVTETKDLFDEADFRRVDWDLDGVPSAPPLPDGTPGPFLDMDERSIERFTQGLGSASMVIRWRQANPDKANTEKDVVNITAERLKQATGGRETLPLSGSTTMLLFRRK